MLRAATCGSCDDLVVGEARARRRARPRTASSHASSLRRGCDAQLSMAGRSVGLEVVDPALARREARIVDPLRVADQRRPAPANWCSRPTCMTNQPSSARNVVSDQRADVAAAQAHRPEVRDDVGHRHQRVEHGDVDVLALAGAVAVAQRGEDADGGEQRGADVAERADRVGDRRRVALRHERRRCPHIASTIGANAGQPSYGDSTVLPKPETDT